MKGVYGDRGRFRGLGGPLLGLARGFVEQARVESSRQAVPAPLPLWQPSYGKRLGRTDSGPNFGDDTLVRGGVPKTGPDSQESYNASICLLDSSH